MILLLLYHNTKYDLLDSIHILHTRFASVVLSLWNIKNIHLQIVTSLKIMVSYRHIIIIIITFICLLFHHFDRSESETIQLSERESLQCSGKHKCRIICFLHCPVIFHSFLVNTLNEIHLYLRKMIISSLQKRGRTCQYAHNRFPNWVGIKWNPNLPARHWNALLLNSRI